MEYAQKGYDLTLRQLYYQLVTRNVFANTEQSYKRLGSIISDARRAGCIDWRHIVDRTRNTTRRRTQRKRPTRASVDTSASTAMSPGNWMPSTRKRSPTLC